MIRNKQPPLAHRASHLWEGNSRLPALNKEPMFVLGGPKSGKQSGVPLLGSTLVEMTSVQGFDAVRLVGGVWEAVEHRRCPTILLRDWQPLQTHRHNMSLMHALRILVKVTLPHCSSIMCRVGLLPLPDFSRTSKTALKSAFLQNANLQLEHRC